ncbi:MAG: HPr-rel-A system PqqD family peptide chaperone [Acidimicrobiia bacterium]
MSQRFSLAEHLVCRRTSSDLRMLFDRKKGVMYELNETASAVVERLENGPASTESLHAQLAAEFEVSAEELQADVDRLLADFHKAGLVTVEE